MSELDEKRYSIDPGKGKKMDGCPYSNFQDGHDVQEYIIPPKGYVFSGFRFDPDAKNQIYDGKLYALYTKEPFKIRLKSNSWKFLLILVIVLVVGLIILLSLGVFKGSKSSSNTPQKPKTEAEAKSNTEHLKTDNSLTNYNESNNKPQQSDKGTENDKGNQGEEKPVVQPQETSQPTETEPNARFKQEFWDLIHNREPSMDVYTDLYNKYKADANGEEFDYLRFTILKNFVSFKEWFAKLKLIPDRQLTSMTSVSELSQAINKQ